MDSLEGLDCNGITIKKSTREDAACLSDNLREADIREIYRASKRTPLVALCNGLRSSRCFTAHFEGHPVMMFGLMEDKSDPTIASVWALGTDWITENPLKFQRVTNKVLPLMSDGYSVIGGLVDAKNTVHVRWLIANGFEFDPNIRLINKNPFYLFYKDV